MNETKYQEWLKDEILPSDEELAELEHHGIKGMKWGVRRTPEQLGHKSVKKKKPSIFANVKKKRQKAKKLKIKEAEKKKKEKAKKEEESDEKIREKVLVSTDPSYIYKHRNLLTTKELSDRINRIDTEAKIKSLSDKKTKKGFDTIKQLNDIAKMAESIGKIAENTKKVYDAYDTISNKKANRVFLEENRNEQRRKRAKETIQNNTGKTSDKDSTERGSDKDNKGKSSDKDRDKISTWDAMVQINTLLANEKNAKRKKR